MGRPRIRSDDDRRAYKRKWANKNYEKNRERIREYRRIWREKNKDHINYLSRKWRADNRDRVKETTRAYLLRNRLKLNAQSLAWQKKNRDKVYVRNARRRALKAKVRHIPYSREEIFTRDKGICFVCNKLINLKFPPRHRLSFTIHHIKAIFLGGDDIPENVVSAHYGCNSSIGIRG